MNHVFLSILIQFLLNLPISAIQRSSTLEVLISVVARINSAHSGTTAIVNITNEVIHFILFFKQNLTPINTVKMYQSNTSAIFKTNRDF